MSEMNQNRRRAIPRPPVIDVDTDVSEKGISPKNKALIIQLQEQLTFQGVLDKETSITGGARTIDEIDVILNTAMEQGLSEADINEEFYDPEVEKLLEGLEDSGSNPIMEDFDDYEGMSYNRMI